MPHFAMVGFANIKITVRPSLRDMMRGDSRKNFGFRFKTDGIRVDCQQESLIRHRLMMSKIQAASV